MLCALELSTRLHVNSEVYSYGTPRIGNHDFASLYNSHVPHTFRVCCDRDIITTLPKLFCLYKHAGCEVIVDRFGNFIVDPLYVEKLFRSSRMSFQDHRLGQYLHALHKGCEQYGVASDYKLPPKNVQTGFMREEKSDMQWAEEQGIDLEVDESAEDLSLEQAADDVEIDMDMDMDSDSAVAPVASKHAHLGVGGSAALSASLLGPAHSPSDSPDVGAMSPALSPLNGAHIAPVALGLRSTSNSVTE